VNRIERRKALGWYLLFDESEPEVPDPPLLDLMADQLTADEWTELLFSLSDRAVHAYAQLAQEAHEGMTLALKYRDAARSATEPKRTRKGNQTRARVLHLVAEGMSTKQIADTIEEISDRHVRRLKKGL
jgi:DNA-binding NarL/FixJ family response regulator